MARVPVPVGNTVEARPVPGGGLQAPDMTAGARMVGEAAARLGEGLGNFAKDQDEIDATLDEAGSRQLDTEYSAWSRAQLFTNDDAFYSKQGFAAGNARPGMEKAIADQRQALLARATTTRMRYLAEQALERRTSADLEGIARHASDQVRVENVRQRAARTTTAGNDAVTYFNDPTRFSQELAVGISEIRGQAADTGAAPEATALAEKTFISDVHERISKGLIQRGNIEEGHAWIEAHRDKLLPDTSAALDGALYHPLLERRADGVVDMLMGLAAPSTEPQVATAKATGEVLPRMLGITAQAESGNRERNRDGSIVTSLAGAQGKMQVMPTTNLDPGYGVTPAKDASDEERTRVGRDYLAALLKHYDGDPSVAWGAYNWGPGNVDAAIKKYGKGWLAHAPAATQAYVRGNVAALGGRGPVVQQAPGKHDLGELLARVDQMELPFDLEQEVRRQVIGRVSTDETLLNRNQDAAAERAWGIVEQKQSTKRSDIPQDVWNGMNPKDKLAVEAHIDQNARGAAAKTDYGVYTALSDMYATDPQSFARQNPSTYATKLAPDDYERVLGWRREVLSNQANAGRGTGQVTFGRVRDVTRDAISARLPEILPPARRGARKDPALVADRDRRIYTFETAVLSDVEIWQRQNPGKQITDAEISAISDRLLLRWHPEGEKPTDAPHWIFDRQPGDRIGYVEVPKSEMDRLRRQARGILGREATPQELLEAYRREARGGF